MLLSKVRKQLMLFNFFKGCGYGGRGDAAGLDIYGGIVPFVYFLREQGTFGDCCFISGSCRRGF
jgi:hypothetical protein